MTPHRDEAPTKIRAKSASEIAKSTKDFGVWESHQGCQGASFDDVPADFMGDVRDVFRLEGRFPLKWVREETNTYNNILHVLPEEFAAFLKEAYRTNPELFSADVLHPHSKDMLSELQLVFAAWRRLNKMQDSSRQWSEADYVANVYNVLRSPAVRESDFRSQCSITLSQPFEHRPLKPTHGRIVNVKTASPDGSLFVPTRLLSNLADTADSPYNILSDPGHTISSGSGSDECAFRYQSTPCVQPNTPNFEFASTFWEDKKQHEALDGAYRQNRMATVAAVRQLHALDIKAPIFGLAWARGAVRAHVDWYHHSPDGRDCVYSAPYPGPASRKNRPRRSVAFHEWDLSRPADILQVYLLVQNLDTWTVGVFRDKIVQGITGLAERVKTTGEKIRPWKRVGEITVPPPLGEKAPRGHHVSVAPSDASISHTPCRKPARSKR